MAPDRLIPLVDATQRQRGASAMGIEREGDSPGERPAGDGVETLDSLFPVVYDEPRRLARHHLRRERPGHTLQPTALVHEAYMRLAEQRRMDWGDRARFFGAAAQTMRRVLVNHARARGTAKRGASATPLAMSEAAHVAVVASDEELLALDEALTALAALDARQARVVELRYF